MGENRHFKIIEKAIKFIRENFDSNLKLAEISEYVGSSTNKGEINECFKFIEVSSC